jgi:methyltransferase family protein
MPPTRLTTPEVDPDGSVDRSATLHGDAHADLLTASDQIANGASQAFFRDAGIIPGMRVFDVGSGAGDVAFLVADLVGDSGEVVGVDRAPNAVARAEARADAESRRNVFFREGDPLKCRSTGRSTRSSDASCDVRAALALAVAREGRLASRYETRCHSGDEHQNTQGHQAKNLQSPVRPHASAGPFSPTSS